MINKIRIKEGESAYTSMLFVAGIALILSGNSAIQTGWVFSWCGVGFVLVGLAYARLGAGIFGKQLDGGRFWLNRLILCPFLLLNYVLWHLRHRVFSREDIFNEVAPGIWLGRRPLDGELPPNVSSVVDLTAEFSATRQARKLNYICVPTLDGSAPSDTEFCQLMSRLSTSSEPVYIHCAAGHGRSATVAVALIIARGFAGDLIEAEEIVKSKRPGVSIKKPQKELLQRWFEARNRTNAGLTESGDQVRRHRSCLDLMKRTLTGAGYLLLWIAVVLVAAIFAIGISLKIYFDYQKHGVSALIGLMISSGLMFWSFWSSRSNGD